MPRERRNQGVPRGTLPGIQASHLGEEPRRETAKAKPPLSLPPPPSSLSLAYGGSSSPPPFLIIAGYLTHSLPSVFVCMSLSLSTRIDHPHRTETHAAKLQRKVEGVELAWEFREKFAEDLFTTGFQNLVLGVLVFSNSGTQPSFLPGIG